MAEKELRTILTNFNYEPCVNCHYGKERKDCYEYWQSESTSALCPAEIDKLTAILLAKFNFNEAK